MLDSRLRLRAVVKLWHMLPAIVVASLLLLGHLPGLPAALALLPWPAALMTMCYWCLHERARFSYPAVLGLGLLESVLSGTPPGTQALALLLLRFLASRTPPTLALEGFFMLWLTSSALLTLTLAAEWVLMSLYVGLPYPPFPAATQLALGVLTYPGIHAACHMLARRFHKKYWYALK